jgi:hypothetical protein
MKVLWTVLLLALMLAACSKKKPEVVVPPGFCESEAECQPLADRQNIYQHELRQKLVAQGVHGRYLPCGKYQPTKAANGFWQVMRDTAGCPPTASQQDPHPQPQSRQFNY